MVRGTILHQNARGRMPERRSRLPPWAGHRWFPARQPRLPRGGAGYLAVKDRLLAGRSVFHWTWVVGELGGWTSPGVGGGARQRGARQEPGGSSLSASAMSRTRCDRARGWSVRGAGLEAEGADPGRRHYPSAGPDLPGVGPLSPGRFQSSGPRARRPRRGHALRGRGPAASCLGLCAAPGPPRSRLSAAARPPSTPYPCDSIVLVPARPPPRRRA